MTFQNYQIYSAKEVEQIRSGPRTSLPSQFKMGETVKYWCYGEQMYDIQMIEAIVVGISFSTVDPGPGMQYALAFRIADSDYYAVLRGIRGNMTSKDVTEFTPGDGEVELTPELNVSIRRHLMRVVPPIKDQLDPS